MATRSISRDQYLQSRQQFLLDKDLLGAAEIGEKYLRDNPNDAVAYHQLAWTLTGLRRFDDAVRSQQKAVDLAPTNPEYANSLDRLLAATKCLSLTTDQLAARARQRFDELENEAKASILAKITRGLELAGESGPLKYSWLITDFSTDVTPGWINNAPNPVGEGEVATIPKVGRYFVDDLTHVVHKRLARGIPWEAPVLALLMEFASRSKGAVLDIGANIGCHTVPLASISKVFAYEPAPLTFERLEANMRLNDLTATLSQKALSSSPGRGVMLEVNPNNPGQAQLVAGDDVDVVTLDTETLPRISVIKMDVEGHEADVIAGGREKLLEDKPVIICEILAGASTKAELESLGYVGYHFHRCDWLFYHPNAGRKKGRKAATPARSARRRASQK